MAADLDSLDHAIIDLLLLDARTPAAQIAEQIGLSRPAVAERIDKMQQSGVIRGTTVVLDPTSLGLGVTAFVSARQGTKMDARRSKAFRAFLTRRDVIEAHSVAGDDCYLIKVRTDSIASLNRLVGELTSEPLSLATRTTIVLETFTEKLGGIALEPRGSR